MKKEDIVIPFIHLNGTSINELYDQRADTLEGIRNLAQTMNRMAPNQRDYYLAEKTLWELAVQQHHRRIDVLNELLREIEYELNLVCDIRNAMEES